MLVHGGAGHVPGMRRATHEAGCVEAARAGYDVLERGGSAVDAVVASAAVLEDLPQYNAGTGACLNELGAVEHDAAVMDGHALTVGAVCALTSFKNPIQIARAVLDDGRHVLLAGAGARAFALSRGHAEVDPETLVTELARTALQRVLDGNTEKGWAGGTIGAVARDRAGHLAAATSTGGMIAKRPGRVGDSPIPGAGTYADDASAAVSATGDGEAFLRMVLAHAVTSAVEAGTPLDGAALACLTRLVERTRGTGGLIAIDRTGAWVAARLTETMSFAVASDAGVVSGI